MNEQGWVDLERIRRKARLTGWVELPSGHVEALLAVVDAARAVHGCGESDCSLCVALEPFTPAEEEERGIDHGAAMVATKRLGRAFNERMQAEERARRLAALGIQVVDPPVSDAVSSGAGGRSESCARADGPQIPSGPAPSSVDRERVRRDAEWWISTPAAYEDRSRSVSDRIARHCLALLAELEQAERGRDVALVQVVEMPNRRAEGAPAVRSAEEHVERLGCAYKRGELT